LATLPDGIKASSLNRLVEKNGLMRRMLTSVYETALLGSNSRNTATGCGLIKVPRRLRLGGVQTRLVSRIPFNSITAVLLPHFTHGK
jgi:hypothetical protein